ncbi:hypothetical protein [Streptomyces sp. NPDC059761]|uniref:hypothetical protein n=1 Tax=Streptomyces sp. NPDC059761 TaxID=3346937 RepID=UPI00364B6D3B
MPVITCENPHTEGYDPNSASNSPEATAAHKATHDVKFEGAVLRLRERNGYDDSDWYALVWDEEQQKTREVFYATTRGWTYHNGASIDATHDVIEKAVAHTAATLLANWEREHGEKISKGMTASVTVKGETLTGMIRWEGESKPRTAWAARYGTPTKRYGLQVEGRTKYVFADADKLHDVVRTPWTTEERAEMTERAEARARGQYSEATAAADKRAAEAPAVVVAPVADVAPALAVETPQRPVERHVGALAEDMDAKGVAAAVEVLGAGGHFLATLTNIVGDWSAEGVFVMPGGSRNEERAGVRVRYYADGRPEEAQGSMTAKRREARRAARNEALDGCARTLRAAGWSVMHQEHKTTRTRCVGALLAWPPVG